MSEEKKIDFNRLMTVGEVSKRSGVAVSTIHFYEAKGLIKSTRTNGNQRRFSAITLRYIGLIKVAQRVGIPLEEVKDALSFYPVGSKRWIRKFEQLL